MGLYGGALPDFPWDSLAEVRQRAASYPAGAVDLTIGSPADPVPEVIRSAFTTAADAHGYPANVGTARLREEIVSWLIRRRGLDANGPQPGVLPTIGSKELIALLPAFLGLGAPDTVGYPAVAYPTYDVGARLAGATPVPIDIESDPHTWPKLSLLWLNSPGNPDGHVLDMDQLRRIRQWAKGTGTVIASDECYGELVWDVAQAPSILDAWVCEGDLRGLLCVYSLSKQSNLAGYRAAFVAGDPSLIGPLAEVRKHAGFMVPGPVQAAMVAALADDAHVERQRARYARRREALLEGFIHTGLVNDPKSVAGLYLWLSAPHSSLTGRQIVSALAEIGIIATPGDFYGEISAGYIRVSLTAPDSDIAQAAERLAQFRLPGASEAKL